MNKLIRQNISELKQYVSARQDFVDMPMIYLDANENPYGIFNRYPDPNQNKIRDAVSKIYDIDKNEIIIGNGSDELIDLVFRIFATPNVDNVILPQPTYGMYKVIANVNNVAVKNVQLNCSFNVVEDDIIGSIDDNSKILILCSPNNPTGNSFDEKIVENIIKNFNGIVIIDQAYGEFSQADPWRQKIKKFNNLIVVQTFSKAWGTAGLRAGIAFACEEIINLLFKIKLPYNVNAYTQSQLIKLLKNKPFIDTQVNQILINRNALIQSLRNLKCVSKVYCSEANFILVKVADNEALYEFLRQRNILVRKFSDVLLDNTIRISVGNEIENRYLISVLTQYDKNS